MFTTTPTGRLFFFIVLCTLPFISSADALFAIPGNTAATVCPSPINPATHLSENAADCETRTLSSLDPQNTRMWVQFTFEHPREWHRATAPYGLYLFGKTSSRVYLNGELLGSNGEPAEDKSELPGKIDSVFHIPEGLLRDSGNLLTAELSGHHSLLKLDHPIHTWAIGNYGDPKRFVQRFSDLGLILAGAFLLGAFYFLTLCFGPSARRDYRVFALLCSLAAIQVLAEISRGIWDYPYALHDYRLLLVTLCSCSFGIGVLSYSSVKVAEERAVHWVYTGGILTLLGVLTAPGFDNKTTAGIFVPLLLSQIQLGVYWLKNRAPSLLRWFTVQLIILSTIYIGAALFHEIVYFLLIGVFLGYLFSRQAREHRAQSEQLQLEQTRLAKLEFKLAQNDQAQSSSKLTVNLAGSTQYLNTSDIAYCKAAGDYVELHLTDHQEKLYSGSLKQLEEVLPPTFLRVHRSFVVNLNEVRSLSSQLQGKQKLSVLVLQSEQQVPVSRRLLPTVKDSLKTAHG